MEFDTTKADSDKKAFGDIPSKMNRGLHEMRMLHLVCAIMLVLSKILEAADFTSRAAKFLNQTTIFIYLYLFIESFHISRENYPFKGS